MNSYHVLELVGEGSFGRVFKGRRRFTGQVVALKFMPKVGRSEKEIRSLKREIEIMRGLQHPNIVQLFDSFETDTEVVVVTDYAEGQLFQILEDDGSLPESQVREIACQLVSALYYLHSHRILHRDMKPQNILLGKTGVVKLCDFGFARAMSVSTLVLTSIKGTPLYMSPELVEEKPYDHTADLWSLGCILYELHTGAPPFCTNSIFHLVQLIVRDQVKWPDNMSDTCMSFLKGLLTKDPQKRLSWPDLLQHPFVADGVLVLSDTNVYSPLTVTPSPDLLALKLKQVAEKTVPASGESKLLRKVREQGDNKRKPKKKEGTERASCAAASPNIPEPPSRDVSSASGQLVTTAANQVFKLKNPACTRSKQRGSISRDYEQQFPSIEPRPLQRCNEDGTARRHGQDVDQMEFWESLALKSDPSRQPKERLNYIDIVPQIKSEITAVQAQVSGGIGTERQILQPLKVLRNLTLMPDREMSHRVCHDLDLPAVLFDMIQNSVENSEFIKEQWSVAVLGEMMTLLLIYWEKHFHWVEEESSKLEEFTRPFSIILSRPDLIALAPLAAAVLSLFTQHIDVPIDLDNLTSLLQTLLLDSNELQRLLPSGWGLCDGFLSLILHTLSVHENAPLSPSFNSVLFVNLWKKVGTSLTTSNLEFCSGNGLHSLLSITLFVFTKDPYSCVSQFTENGSKCVSTLVQLLRTDCFQLFSKDAPERPEVELSRDSLSVLSCQLLCFPFALDVPSHTLSTVLQLYDSCGVVSGLLQVIRTLPPPLLELPVSLLSRLLLCDPERFVSHLREAAPGFFSSDAAGLASSRHQAPLTRTTSSLLAELLQFDTLWDSATELLIFLSQVAHHSLQPACPPLHIDASVLQQALTHSYDQIRAASCKLLGNINPFRALTTDARQPDVFRGLINCLCDSYMPVRRMACRAVGNWLGYIAEGPGIKKAGSDGNGAETAGRGQEKEHDKLTCSHADAATVAEQRTGSGDRSRWMEEARRSAATLAGLLSDPDALIRRHCCAALRNLVNVDGAVALLLGGDVPGLLLRVACTDSHDAVREAAVASLSLYIQLEEMRQVLTSLGASKKLSEASQCCPPPQTDYQQLLGLLQSSSNDRSSLPQKLGNNSSFGIIEEDRKL